MIANKIDDSAPVDDVRQWARQELGAAEGEDRAALRQRFFRHLAENDFWAAPATLAAWQALGDDNSPPGYRPLEYTVWVRERLAREIDEFAHQFFSLDMVARRARYDELARQCTAQKQCRSRLGALGRGVDVNTKALERRHAKIEKLPELIRVVEQLFTARPEKRSAILAKLSRVVLADRDAWVLAAKTLWWSYRPIYSLQPELIELLAKLRNRRGPGNPSQLTWQELVLAQAPKRPVSVPQHQSQQRGEASDSTHRFWPIVWIGLMMCGGLLNGMLRKSFVDLKDRQSRQTRSSYPSYPSYHFPPPATPVETAEQQAHKQRLSELRVEYNNPSLVAETATMVAVAHGDHTRLIPKAAKDSLFDVTSLVGRGRIVGVLTPPQSSRGAHYTQLQQRYNNPHIVGESSTKVSEATPGRVIVRPKRATELAIDAWLAAEAAADRGESPDAATPPSSP